MEDDPEDEILTELKQKQEELKTLCQHNINMTKNLLEKAREEMKKQELKKKLAAIDSEVFLFSDIHVYVQRKQYVI